MSNTPHRIIISGGGTGGHIFPAIAIANALRRRHPDAEFLFVGALGRMEMERVPAAGFEITGLPVAGFDRRRLWRNFAVVAKLFKSMRRARRILRDFRPDICIGVGGYASGPMLKAAQKAGIPTLIQEQNSYAGVTNKMLARGARRICVAYDEMERFFPKEAIVLTGNPIRHDIATCTTPAEAARKALGFDPERKLLLVVGGSLGALTINESMSAALPRLAEAGIQVLWQTGKSYAEKAQRQAAGYPGIKASAFISEMATAYAAADLVVARAGAATISELQLLGKPAILVPSPNVAEDHQRKNALALVKADAARMVLDADARACLADEILSVISDPNTLASLSANVSRMALRDSDEKIADEVDRII
ncbi:MAG: undecaprenyldiphospho-muramoylpentapeptide beta-N-acetylglucosaminyltransferase, partial [Paramuribaculum sp.]|nr:undecaprenyldiphospho-muramoylpentapeptide beta-N-acetylglucosaminyltransferase [Paramuribaculum sp.]